MCTNLKISLIFYNAKIYVFKNQKLAQELTICLCSMISEILNISVTWKSYQQAVLASQFTKDELARYSDGPVFYRFT